MRRSLEEYLAGVGQLDTAAAFEEAKELCLSGVFPFCVATRFKFSSVAQIRKSRKRIKLSKEAASPLDLLDLFCFSFFEEISSNYFEALLPEFKDRIDSLLEDYCKSHRGEWENGNVDTFVRLLLDEHRLVESGGAAPPTPEPLVAEIMESVKLNAPIFDPAFGYGTFLLKAKSALVESGLSEIEALHRIGGMDPSPRKAYLVAALLDPHEKGSPGLLAITDPVKAIKARKILSLMKSPTIVFGNPPFQEETGLDGTATRDLAGDFVLKIQKHPPKMMALVLPERKRKQVEEALFGGGLKKYKILGRSAFPSINMDTCFVLCEAGYEGPIQWEDYRGFSTVIEKGAFVPNLIQAIPIFERLKGACGEWSKEHRAPSRSLGSRFSGAGAGISSGIHSTTIKEHCRQVPRSSPDAIEVALTPLERIVVSLRELEEARGLDRKSKTKHLDVLAGYQKHKVLVLSAGSRVSLGPLAIGEYSQACGWTCCRFETDSKEEAENLKAYLETKFVRALVRALKTSTANTKTNIFNHIPDVDLTVKWTDAKLYRHFELTEKEIRLVEELSICS